MLTSWIVGRAHRRFVAACEDPFVAQADKLRAILRDSSRTDLGRRHAFAALAHIADPAAMITTYQRTVPVRTAREMRADLDAVYAGEWPRLCAEAPVFFAMTAGSTGQFKYIPVTPAYRAEIGRGSQIFYGGLERAFPGLRKKRCQFLVGSAEGGSSPSGVPQGFASGANYKHLPRLVRRRFALPYWVFTLPDADDRAYAAGRLLVAARDLGALCAISPMNLVNVRAMLDRCPERLCADIANGTLTTAGDPAFPGRWRGSPDRELAAALRRRRRIEGRFPVELLFPALEVLVCWRGGNMGYYRHALDDAFGRMPHFEFPISASEALFAIPVTPDGDGGVLAVTSHFLEFIPERAAGGPFPPVLRADQLVSGGTYRIVVTTSGGLYRYDMEDLVEATGWCGRTPVIRFVSKADRQISVSNERLTELDVSAAMRNASAAHDVWFDDFLFVPCTDRRYRVLVDGATLTAMGGPPLAGLAETLERELRAASKGYDFEREDLLLDPLELVVTAPGQLHAHLTRGQRENPLPNAQVKPMHLTPQFDLHATFDLTARHALPNS